MPKHQLYLETETLEYLIEIVKGQDESDSQILLLADLIRAKSKVAGQRGS